MGPRLIHHNPGQLSIVFARASSRAVRVAPRARADRRLRDGPRRRPRPAAPRPAARRHRPRGGRGPNDGRCHVDYARVRLDGRCISPAVLAVFLGIVGCATVCAGTSCSRPRWSSRSCSACASASRHRLRHGGRSRRSPDVRSGACAPGGHGSSERIGMLAADARGDCRGLGGVLAVATRCFAGPHRARLRRRRPRTLVGARPHAGGSRSGARQSPAASGRCT